MPRTKSRYTLQHKFNFVRKWKGSGQSSQYLFDRWGSIKPHRKTQQSILGLRAVIYVRCSSCSVCCGLWVSTSLKEDKWIIFVQIKVSRIHVITIFWKYIWVRKIIKSEPDLDEFICMTFLFFVQTVPTLLIIHIKHTLFSHTSINDKPSYVLGSLSSHTAKLNKL